MNRIMQLYSRNLNSIYTHTMSINKFLPISRTFTSAWKLKRDKDQFANRAIAQSLRSRAAFKLEELNTRFGRFLRQGTNVVDLGAAPGGFSIIAAKHIHLDTAIDRWQYHAPYNKSNVSIQRTLGGKQKKRKFGKLICVDLQSMDPIEGATFIQDDITNEKVIDKIINVLDEEEADVVVSDMAPFTTSDKETNHLQIMQLAEQAFHVASKLLRNGGLFCCKIFRGREEIEFRKQLENHFVKVKAFKPIASRKESTEIYYVAQGYVPMHMNAEKRDNNHDEEMN